MPSFNKVELMGNITRDPELRFTSGGVPVANFGLAVNRVRSKNEAVDFFDVTAWREIGETITNYKGKGDPVFVEGRLEFQQYQDKDGNNRSKHIVVVENVQFLSSGNGSGNGGQSGNQGSGQGARNAPAEDAEAEEDYSDIPF